MNKKFESIPINLSPNPKPSLMAPNLPNVKVEGDSISECIKNLSINPLVYTHILIQERIKERKKYLNEIIEKISSEHFDVGLLNDYGGGDIEWWHNYIRSLLEQSREFYINYLEGFK